MVDTYSGILLSHEKNAFESILMRWMNLEPIIWSEISQKEKSKYSNTYIYGIRRDSTDEPICKGAMET